MSEPSPYCKIAVGNLKKKSVPRSKTTDPKWEENFQFLISDPRNQELDVEVSFSCNFEIVYSFVALQTQSDIIFI